MRKFLFAPNIAARAAVKGEASCEASISHSFCVQIASIVAFLKSFIDPLLGAGLTKYLSQLARRRFGCWLKNARLVVQIVLQTTYMYKNPRENLFLINLDSCYLPRIFISCQIWSFQLSWFWLNQLSSTLAREEPISGAKFSFCCLVERPKGFHSSQQPVSFREANFPIWVIAEILRSP